MRKLPLIILEINPLSRFSIVSRENLPFSSLENLILYRTVLVLKLNSFLIISNERIGLLSSCKLEFQIGGNKAILLVGAVSWYFISSSSFFNIILSLIINYSLKMHLTQLKLASQIFHFIRKCTRLLVLVTTHFLYYGIYWI